MDSDNIARLVYLTLIATSVLGWYLVQNREKPGKTLQFMAVWGLIFIGVIAGIGLWQDIRNDVLPRQSYSADGGVIEIPRARDGHYYVTLEVNGAPVEFVVDTGASHVVLTKADAMRVGIDPDTLVYDGIAGTANGEVPTASVRLDRVQLGDIVDTRVRASVNGGEMDGSLLGMTYLQRFDKIEIGRGKLILRR
jgi:aspartyl protease family protein